MTPTPRADTASSSLLGWRAATDRRGDLSCLAGPSIPEVELMTTTHTHSAPPRADAAPDRFTPPTHRARHLITLIGETLAAFILVFGGLFFFAVATLLEAPLIGQ